MALSAVNVTIGQSLGGGAYSSSIKGSSVPAFAATTTVAADVATLVADGASPTQAHVNTLNTDWTAFLAGYTPGSVTGDVTVIWDASTITSKNQLRAALRKALEAVDGGLGGLT